VKEHRVNRRQETSATGATADESRTGAPDAGGTIDGADAAPDLLRVALAAWAAHVDQHSRGRIPGAATPWGRSARIAGLRRFDAR
jgi:hypothetical protein